MGKGAQKEMRESENCGERPSQNCRQGFLFPHGCGRRVSEDTLLLRESEREMTRAGHLRATRYRCLEHVTLSPKTFF